jgi:YD repeat-containing protein
MMRVTPGEKNGPQKELEYTEAGRSVEEALNKVKSEHKRNLKRIRDE